MRFLRRHFKPVKASRIQSELGPEIGFAVTLDDGYEDNYRVAAPILKKLGIPATFYAIRPFAVGRRNWLFSDTPRGARASATCFSLIETARANNLEPYGYLVKVLQNIAAADTIEKIGALLPWNVK